MNLKDRLVKETQLAKDVAQQKELAESIRKEKETQRKMEEARLKAFSIIDTIEEKALAAAKDKQSKVDIHKTDFNYADSGNRDYTIDKLNFYQYKQEGFFNKNLVDGMVTEYIVNNLDMTVVFEFRHDGVGVNSWYMLVMKW